MFTISNRRSNFNNSSQKLLLSFCCCCFQLVDSLIMKMKCSTKERARHSETCWKHWKIPSKIVEINAEDQ